MDGISRLFHGLNNGFIVSIDIAVHHACAMSSDELTSPLNIFIIAACGGKAVFN